MKLRNLFPNMIEAFALRRPLDYIVKPTLSMVVFLGLFAAARSAVFGFDIEVLPELLLLLAAVQFPFLVLAFAMINYLHGLQSRLADLALTDVLTGLPNRRAFISAANELQQNGANGFLLILDADHFKSINDTYGHAAGDLCLQAIANRLANTFSAEDVIGRIGGEEFGAFVPYATKGDIEKLGGRLCHTIIVEIDDPKATLRFTLSAGASETKPGERIEAGLQRADEALYSAKANGRAHLELWHRGMVSEVA